MTYYIRLHLFLYLDVLNHILFSLGGDIKQCSFTCWISLPGLIKVVLLQTTSVYILTTTKYIMALISLTISAVLAIILGVLILVWPSLLRWGVGIYLILFGVLQLFGQYY